MNIPDEAVEAATEALKVFFDGKPPRGARAATRLALEAAAPFIAARAWEEGEKTGYSNCLAVEHGLEQAPNPYIGDSRDL